MDSVRRIMENANNLLTRAISQKDCMNVEFKSASLLTEQNKLQSLFNSDYEDGELAKQKIRCIKAYIYLEYAMIPYDEECKRNYYLRCEVSDIYTKCRNYIFNSKKNYKSNITEFIYKCYKPISLLNDEARLSTNQLDEKKINDIRSLYYELVGDGD